MRNVARFPRIRKAIIIVFCSLIYVLKRWITLILRRGKSQVKRFRQGLFFSSNIVQWCQTTSRVTLRLEIRIKHRVYLGLGKRRTFYGELITLIVIILIYHFSLAFVLFERDLHLLLHWRRCPCLSNVWWLRFWRWITWFLQLRIW